MVVEINNLKKEYYGKYGVYPVFSNLNLCVEKGDFIALKGRSGCGKSTLLKIIGCIEPFNGGNYYLEGQNIAELSESQLALVRSKKIGFVFQNFNLIKEYTVFENIEVPLGYAGVPKKKRKEIVQALLMKVGLSDKADSFPEQISGGQQQRVAIARALANNPEIILADEPTGNLDEENRDIVMALFRELNNEGITIIMVSHDENTVLCADKTVNFSDLLQ